MRDRKLAVAGDIAQLVLLKTGFVQRVGRLRGEKAPDDALTRELGAMGLF